MSAGREEGGRGGAGGGGRGLEEGGGNWATGKKFMIHFATFSYLFLF